MKITWDASLAVGRIDAKGVQSHVRMHEGRQDVSNVRFGIICVVDPGLFSSQGRLPTGKGPSRRQIKDMELIVLEQPVLKLQKYVY